MAASSAYAASLPQEEILGEHCERMVECKRIMAMMIDIYTNAVDTLNSNTLTATASSHTLSPTRSPGPPSVRALGAS